MFGKAWGALDFEQRRIIKRECGRHHYAQNREKSYARTQKYLNKDKMIAKSSDPVKYKYAVLKNRTNRSGVAFSFSLEEFRVWYAAQPQECTYCGISAAQLPGMPYNKRFLQLSIDRKDSAKGYQPGNICFACMKCNTSKSNYISYSDMREIGRIYLRPVWETMLRISAAVA